MAVSRPHPDEALDPAAAVITKRPASRLDKDRDSQAPDAQIDPKAAQDPTQAYDLARLKRYFSESRDLTYQARTNSLLAQDYYDSDQFTDKQLKALAARSQPPIVINRIKPAVNGIVGVIERGQSDPKCWPRNPDDSDSADAATDVLRYISDYNRFKRVKQDCFRDMLVPGTMAALVGCDDDRQVTVTQIRWEEFFGDPRSRRADWKDARYLGIAKWMYADDVGALYPDKARDIELAVQASAAGGMVPDQSYQDRPQWGPGTGSAWIDPKQRRLMVVEIYFRDDGWKRAVFTSMDLLEAGASPYLDHKGRPDCPIEAHSAYVKRDNSRYGVVWDMIGVQDEINQRRSKSLHNLATTRIQVTQPGAIDVDASEARKEAAKPDGVIPYGWNIVPNTASFQGNLELLTEAKSEIERMGPNPSVLGRDGSDASGRALLARQQSGLIELGNLYGALEDWELRIYRQCWGRAKQFWTAPQFIRVTDDENSPKFVGLNQPITDQPVIDPATGQPATHPQTGQALTTSVPEIVRHPQTGQPVVRKKVLGYKNAVAEMDVDIEVEAQTESATVQVEAFNELLNLVKMSPNYQGQVTLKQLILLSPISHKRAVLDAIDQAAQQQQQDAAQKAQIGTAMAGAKVADLQAGAQEKQARAASHHASAFAHVANALTEAHAMHADHAVAGLEAGINQGQRETQAQTDAAATAAQQNPPGDPFAGQPANPSGAPQ